MHALDELVVLTGETEVPKFMREGDKEGSVHQVSNVMNVGPRWFLYSVAKAMGLFGSEKYGEKSKNHVVSRLSRILDELTEVDESSRFQDCMKVWFVQAHAKEEAFAGFLCDRCTGLREHQDLAKLGAREQLLAGTYVGLGHKDGYVADMEEKDSALIGPDI
nr:hypothetical protein [Tanacetum cinerariifolium]